MVSGTNITPENCYVDTERALLTDDYFEIGTVCYTYLLTE